MKGIEMWIVRDGQVPRHSQGKLAEFEAARVPTLWTSVCGFGSPNHLLPPGRELLQISTFHGPQRPKFHGAGFFCATPLLCATPSLSLCSRARMRFR